MEAIIALIIAYPPLIIMGVGAIGMLVMIGQASYSPGYTFRKWINEFKSNIGQFLNIAISLVVVCAISAAIITIPLWIAGAAVVGVVDVIKK